VLIVVFAYLSVRQLSTRRSGQNKFVSSAIESSKHVSYVHHHSPPTVANFVQQLHCRHAFVSLARDQFRHRPPTQHKLMSEKISS
jgi:hypothetical protein